MLLIHQNGVSMLNEIAKMSQEPYGMSCFRCVE